MVKKIVAIRMKMVPETTDASEYSEAGKIKHHNKTHTAAEKATGKLI